MSDELKLWDQQPGEPDLTYKVFRRWLLQTEPRDVHKAYRDETGKQYYRKKLISAPADILAAMATWDARARSWNIEQTRKASHVWLQRREEIRSNEYSVATALLDVAREMLRWPLSQDEVEAFEAEDGTHITIVRKPNKWAFRDVSGMVKVASEISRLAAEMESKVSKLVIAFSPEAVEAIDKLEQYGISYPDVVTQFEQLLIREAEKQENRNPVQPQ